LGAYGMLNRAKRRAAWGGGIAAAAVVSPPDGITSGAVI